MIGTISRILSKDMFCLTLLAVLCVSQTTHAQATGCDGMRYLDDLTTSLTVTTVEFGRNVNAVGDTQTLLMDIYEPQVDSIDHRPAIVFAFGGGFVSGSRGTMDLFCRVFAQKGFVTATIDYRIWNSGVLGSPDSVDLMNTAFMAVSDMKAAVRHLKVDAATENLFGVDADRIFIGGVSAGAVTSLHAAYVTPDDLLPPFLQIILEENGGFSGNTGDSLNQSVDADVIGVINLSGGIYDTAWIAHGDVPVISYHGTADEVVPFEFGLGAETVSIMGSGLIHERMENLGNTHYLKTAVGAGHVTAYLPPYLFNEFLEYVSVGTQLIEQELCGITATKPAPLVGSPIRMYPNPASDHLRIESDHAWISKMMCFNQLGQLMFSREVNDTAGVLDISGLADGHYFMIIETTEGRITKQVVVAR